MNPSDSQPGDLFRQAIETYQSAIKTGVKIQEESARRLTEMLRDAGSPLEWQKHLQAMANEAARTTQRNADESLRLMNQNAQMALNLMQKAFEARPTPPREATDAQDDLWESALGALRTNTQVILQANARVLETWAQMAKEVTGRADHAAAEATQATS